MFAETPALRSAVQNAGERKGERTERHFLHNNIWYYLIKYLIIVDNDNILSSLLRSSNIIFYLYLIIQKFVTYYAWLQGRLQSAFNHYHLKHGFSF